MGEVYRPNWWEPCKSCWRPSGGGGSGDPQTQMALNVAARLLFPPVAFGVYLWINAIW